MKKYYKNFKTKRMTVDAMASCYERCFTRCNCNDGCSSGIVNGIAVSAIPNNDTQYDSTMSVYAAAG